MGRKMLDVSTMFKGFISKYLCLSLCLIPFLLSAHDKNNLVKLIKETKSSIVSIALLTPIASNTPQLIGTGFVIGNGKYIATNYHVVSTPLNEDFVQYYVALVGEGKNPQVHKLSIVATDPTRDLAIMSITKPLTPIKLGSNSLVDSGTTVAMIGFPIGAVLGLYPATHTGIVAAVTPDVNPAQTSQQLSADMLQRLNKPFFAYQLDITSFPGNSGSPVLDIYSGEVIGILNKTFISEGRENALSKPSGISYAVPIKRLREFALEQDIKL